MKPAICLAAEAPNAYVAARLYAAMGLSVLPCVGKRPALKYWENLQKRAADGVTINRWDEAELLKNVGIICGAVSNNLVVVDLDGDDAVSRFEGIFSNLLDTYAVRSGSGHGKHYYYWCDNLPPTTLYHGETGNVELRANGMYVVAPPSVHPDSLRNYVVTQATEIMRVPDLTNLMYWIRACISTKQGRRLPPPSNHTPRHTTNYGKVALGNAAADVARAVPGERNIRLFNMALKMGSLIADNWLDRAHVEWELFKAAGALTEADGEAATRKTIASGIDFGMRNPRSEWEKSDQHGG